MLLGWEGERGHTHRETERESAPGVCAYVEQSYYLHESVKLKKWGDGDLLYVSVTMHWAISHYPPANHHAIHL